MYKRDNRVGFGTTFGGSEDILIDVRPMGLVNPHPLHGFRASSLPSSPITSPRGATGGNGRSLPTIWRAFLSLPVDDDEVDVLRRHQRTALPSAPAPPRRRRLRRSTGIQPGTHPLPPQTRSQARQRPQEAARSVTCPRTRMSPELGRVTPPVFR